VAGPEPFNAEGDHVLSLDLEPAGQPGTEADCAVVSQIVGRWRQTGRPDTLAVLAEYPELAERPSVVMDLAQEEFFQRVAAGEDLDPAAFAARFPAVSATVHGLIGAHLFYAQLSAWPRPGAVFSGGYAVLRHLGRGSFAEVFLARQHDVGDRLVVLKVSKRGAREARTLGRLSHPNIVPVHTAWYDSESALDVICMPYLGSATLLTVLQRLQAPEAGRADDGLPPLPRSAAVFGEVARAGLRADEPVEKHPLPDARPLLDGLTYVEGVMQLGLQLAEALAHVHDRGICHGDLKPSNVLLDPDARPMLLDFNLARDPQAHVARLGGTAPYMAPEQLRLLASSGGSRIEEDKQRPSSSILDPRSAILSPVEARSDLFALGVILYELLSGQHPHGPWDGALSPAALARVLLERQQACPRPLAAVNPAVPAPLAALVGRCLAPAPADRPGSAAAVAAELRRCLTPLDQGPAPPPPPGSRPRRAGRGRWVAVGLLLAVGGTILAGGAFFDGGPLPRGRDAYQRGDYRSALQYFDQAVAARPDRADALFARGRTRLQLGDDAGARDDFLKAAKLAPDGRTAAGLGYHLSRMRQHAAAIDCYQRALETGFATAEVYADLGYSYSQLAPKDRYAARAEESLTHALELNPDLQAAYHTRALVELSRACRDATYLPEAGLHDITAALGRGRETADLHYTAACLYARAALHPGQAKAAQTWPGQALAHLAAAVRLGLNPALLRADPSFRALKDLPAFRELCKQPVPPTSPPHAVRLLDPLAGKGI
jgi:serine/threonine protein kinase